MPVRSRSVLSVISERAPVAKPPPYSLRNVPTNVSPKVPRGFGQATCHDLNRCGYGR